MRSHVPCRQPPATSPQPQPRLPFPHVIAFGYDDGPTIGAVACAAETEHYRFELLAIDIDGHHDHQAWDRGEEVRVFGLAHLPEAAYKQIVRLLENVEPPRWPVWVPGTGGAAAPDHPAIDRAESLLQSAAAPTQIIVAGPSLTTPFVAARELDHGPMDTTAPQDWFTFLA